MSDLTPADLAKFIHRVPVGATIPAGTEHAVRVKDTISLVSHGYDYEQAPGALDRWTAEPILTPEHARLEAEYAKACEKVHAAEAALATAERERNAAMPAAQYLYDQLRRTGRR